MIEPWKLFGIIFFSCLGIVMLGAFLIEVFKQHKEKKQTEKAKRSAEKARRRLQLAIDYVQFVALSSKYI